ncbi:adenosylcobinamide-phosphate synthase [Kushneria avicenniae]|uniref:Cobalamin biosynthesis protein CobD n=1 Tax=Kushneria avicenniae TaxID=402385 RepID=A0A1I1FPX8_9GAMM|nr:adenosylcobinamide-phosphate synthase CbiB [Kushneria avicenniae]SFC01056.1 adenosylcobinamide-phosphate synthase [Kushneria avicenniae]
MWLMILAPLLFDQWWGEPRRFHPLIGLGWWISIVEENLYPLKQHNAAMLMTGSVGWVLVIAPFMGFAVLIDHFLEGFWHTLLAVLVLYLAIGRKSLIEHARRVYQPLARGDLNTSRRQVSMLVSRDTQQLDASEISRATCESVLENGSDALFAAIFWFAIAGIPGVVLYRIVNTLDAMWGYRNERYLYFGRTAARMDDAMNWIPARLTALSYALAGWHWRASQNTLGSAIKCWWQQGRSWKSPNAGPVMAAGAGALGIQLGGGGIYHGHHVESPVLGTGRPAVTRDIQRTCTLIFKALLIWLTVLLFIEWVLA